MKDDVVLTTDLPLPRFISGKVRDVYDLGDRLLLVATDRISAFDSILPTGIPSKGRVLSSISAYWFDYTKDVVGNHMISSDVSEYPGKLAPYAEMLFGRSMMVKKAKRVDIECVVRGYLSGSGWKEYQKKGTVCGAQLPAGLLESDRLPEPIFTPAMKADSGHDENISVEKMKELVGRDLSDELSEKATALYEKAYWKAEKSGIIIADTKFEFGIIDDEVILIDEALTPDSSRFWDLSDYAPGRSQKSFDKQFVRDYLESIGWNKEPPAPPLPEDIVLKTAERYREAYRMITGKDL